ncbi:MAG: hypothetical protein IPO93_00380 [Actinobacteria bacterium]|nr:hypothetical protein [Actinomycetota bacterium]
MARRRIRLEKRAVIPPVEGTPTPVADDVNDPTMDPTRTEAAVGSDDSASASGRRRRISRPAVPSGVSLGGLKTLGIVVAVVVVTTLAATLLQAPTPPPAAGATTVEPIGSAVLLCPEPGAGSDLGVRVTAAVVPGQPGQEGSGNPDGAASAAGLETLPGKESASSAITVPGGQAQIEAFGTRLPAIRAFGEGTLAPGLVADQWGRDPGGQGRGMASTACAPAASEFWFVGGGAIAGRQTRIVLVNPDDTSAVVDVLVHGPDGLIDAPAGRGLVIKGEDRLVVRLDVLAPGVTATAVQVLARTGRVGASVDDEQQAGLATVGTDWIPPAAAPATKVFIPGIVSGDGARVLSVMAPGGDDAVVNVRIIGPDGTFAPAERSKIDVSADSVVTIDMAPVLDKVPATLELTANVPIVAGLREFFGGRNVQAETAYTAGAQPFSGPAAASGLPVRPNTDVRVSITAPDSAAEVDIVLLPFRGGKQAAEATPARRVKVGAGKMRYIKLNPPAGIDWYTAVVTPVEGSGPILVAHRVRESSANGDLVTGYPWNPLRVEVTVPTAVQDPAVANR